MQSIRGIEVDESSREELLPGFEAEFPYIATRAEMDRYREPCVPWHWHRAVELFYMESGCLELDTPKGKWVFPAGSGGFVNSNVLHASRVRASGAETVQLLHLFDPALLSGEHGSRMEKKYILPLTASPAVELIGLYPSEPEQAALLEQIRQAFQISPQEWGYEFRLREALTGIWLQLFEMTRPAMERTGQGKEGDDQIKALIAYVHEHFREPVSVEQLAEAVHISKRQCFRLFRENLHMTPVEYIRSCRLQAACQLLTKTNMPVTQIGYACAMGSGSYFGKLFREQFGCSPAQYRKMWHNRDNIQRI